MQRATHAVRYYIVKHDDEAEIKTVPVAIKDVDPSTRTQRPAVRSAASTTAPVAAKPARSRVRQLVRSAVQRVPTER